MSLWLSARDLLVNSTRRTCDNDPSSYIRDNSLEFQDRLLLVCATSGSNIAGLVRISNFSSLTKRRGGENRKGQNPRRASRGRIDSRLTSRLTVRDVDGEPRTHDIAASSGGVTRCNDGIHENIRGESSRGKLADDLSPSLHAPLRRHCRLWQGKCGVPGIVLFLEIRAGLDVRGDGFGHVGCRLTAVLGLLAHPGGHLIRQAGKHLATCVGELGWSLLLSLSHFLLRSNDDVSRSRTRRNRAQPLPKPSRDRSDDGYKNTSSVLATAQPRTA